MPKVELPFESLLEAIEQLDERQLEVLLERLNELLRDRKESELKSRQSKSKHAKPS